MPLPIKRCAQCYPQPAVKQVSVWKDSHASRIKLRLENDVFPWLREKPIEEIDAPKLLEILRRVESRGAIETAHRISQNCGQIFRYAIATGFASRSPATDLRGALTPVRPKHLAAITEPKKVGALLRAIDGYKGTLRIRLASLVFVRLGELRQAEWPEIDFDKKFWVISTEKMKMGESHIVPLARQSLQILEDLHPLTGDGKYVFPGARSKQRPMSNTTITAALRRLGYEKTP